MKKFLWMILLIVLTGCSNEKKLDCTLDLKVGNFEEKWKYSFVFNRDILQTYSTDSLKFYLPNSLQIPIEVTDSSKLQIGDVIAFWDRDSKNIMIHRILDVVVENGIIYFITKGDDNSMQDRNLVSQEDVLFQNIESIDDIQKQSYPYVKNYFEELGYTCR